MLRSPTFSVWLVLRALGGVPDILTTRSYPLAAAGDPPEAEFLNFAGTELDLIHRNDFSFYEEVSTLVQEEPADALDPELAGQLAAIGIIKGQPFTPDARLRAILDNAARIAAGLARTLVFRPRDPRAYYYPAPPGNNGGSAEATSSSPTAPGCSTPAPCSRSSRAASPRRWPPPGSASAPSTPTPPKTPPERDWTDPGTTP